VIGFAVGAGNVPLDDGALAQEHGMNGQDAIIRNAERAGQLDRERFRYQVRVVDSGSGLPLQGVSVRQWDGDELRGESNTGPNGDAWFDSEELGSTLFFTRIGYVDRAIGHDWSSASLTIELDPVPGIDGRFVDRDGISAPGGITVFCRVLSDAGPLASLSANANDSIRATVTDSGGRFQFLDLSEGIYQVQVADLGVVSEPVRVDYSGGTSDVELIGGRARFLRLVLRDAETGDALRSGAEIGGRGIGVRERFLAPSNAWTPFVGSDALALAGSTPVEDLGGNKHVWNLACVIGFAEAGSAKAEIQIRSPGYEEKRVVVEYRDANGESHAEYVDLTSRVIGFGTVEVLVGGIARESRPNLRGVVRLIPDDAERLGTAWLDLPVSIGSERSVVAGVPAGAYKAVFKVPAALFPLHPLSDSLIEVDEGGIVSLEFFLDPDSTTTFELSNSRLDRYSGVFEGVVFAQGADGVQRLPFYFPGPPYTFVALPPGEYSLMTDPPVMFPPPANPREAGARFTVGPETAGVVHDLEVVF
jgi:hypothetical protein